MPGTITLTSGSGEFNATLCTAGGQSIFAIQGTTASGSASISVSPLSATQLIVPNAPGAVQWDETFAITIEAADQYGNVDISYSGTVTWWDSNDYNSGSDWINLGSCVTNVFLYPNERGEDENGNLTIFVSSGALSVSFVVTPSWPQV